MFFPNKITNFRLFALLIQAFILVINENMKFYVGDTIKYF